jgi:D-lactate dehydrogenase
MKIAFFEVTEAWERKGIIEAFGDSCLIFDKPLQEVDLSVHQDIDAILVFIYSHCTSEQLSKLPNLKYLGTRSTGYDHIDKQYCNSKNIVVTNVPRYGENTVAEFALALLLTISRKVYSSIKRVRSGSFDFSGLRGFDLAKRTIGIVGFGNIGQKFAKMCKGLEMNILVYDTTPDKVSAKANEIGVTLVDLETLYKDSDIISLHVPLLPQTTRMINKESISKMKNGVVIINTARGDLINSSDLLDALMHEKVLAAGLDVLEGESMIKDELELLHKENKEVSNMQILVADHMLMNHQNVFVTPHNAFNTQDALERILVTSLSSIKEFIEGRTVVCQIKS